MSRRHLLSLALLLGASAVVTAGAYYAERRERTISVTLGCDGRSCAASIDGGEPLEIDVPHVPGRSLGVYAYHPHEFDRPQAFASLVLRKAEMPEQEIRIEFAPGAWTPAGWRGDPGWRMTERGLSHAGPPGERAVALFPGLDARDFDLTVELVDAVDAGIVFRAADSGTGWVFVARPRHNDAFFFRLVDGQPGPILAMRPARELGAAREALRLGGLVGWILLVTVPLLLLVRAWFSGFGAIAPRVDGIDTASHAPLSWILALGVLTVAALAAVGLRALDGVPHIDDEAAYLFQAKIFAAGDAWAPAPPEPEFFRHEHVIATVDRWYAKYPPLFPALLALGMRAGVPWLVNPVLGALTGFVAYLLGREIAGWRWGIAAWVLLLVSPFFVILGGTLMSHVAAALFVTLFVWLSIRAIGTCRVFPAALAGICLGLAILTRPYTALLAAVAAGSYGLVCLARVPDRRAVVVIGLVAVVMTLPFAWGFVAWGSWVSGESGQHVGLHERYNASDTLGFGPDKGATWLRTWGSFGHTPAKALRSAWQHLEYTSRHLLGWPGCLSLALVVAPFVLGAAGRREWLLLAVLGSLAAGHMAYWAAHHVLYGARYWFEAVPGLMVLAALGLRALVGERGTCPPAPSWARWAPAVALAALVAWGSWVYLPARLRELPAYGGITADLRRQIERLAPARAVVFSETQGLQYDPGFFLNDPFFESERIFARDLGPRNTDLLALYPEYLAYRWAEGQLQPIARAERAR